MPKTPRLTCSEENRMIIESWMNSRTMETRLVERAKIIYKSLMGTAVTQIAKELDIRPNTVIEWRKRFEQKGVSGLYDLPRTGKPPRYDDKFCNDVLGLCRCLSLG